MIRIRIVTTRRQLTQFILLQHKIYADDPVWVPPLIQEERRLLDRRRNPFFRHAEARYFIAEKDGEPVGRIAAVIDHRSNERHQESVGLFGFFESVDDPAVARALLDVAAEAVQGWGATRLRGPIDLSLNERTGLLVEGLGEPPVMMMPYNPPYYLDLLTGTGLEKEKDVLSYRFPVQAFGGRVERVAKIALRKGYQVRGLNRADYPAEMERIRLAYNHAWDKNWGFTPMDEDEFRFLAAGMKPIVRPDLVVFVEREGELAGFGLLLPDINQILRPLRGRLLPFGWLRLLTGLKRIGTVRCILLGVMEDHRMRGIDALILQQFAERSCRIGYDHCDVGWVLEDNLEMTGAILGAGGQPYRRYRVYIRDLPL